MIPTLIQSNYLRANTELVDPMNLNYFYAGYLNQLFEEDISDWLNGCFTDTRLLYHTDQAMKYQASG